MSIPATSPLFRRSRLPIKDRGAWWSIRLARMASFLPILISSVREIRWGVVFPGRSPAARRGDSWEMFEPVNTLEKLDQAVCRLVNRETLLSDEPPRPKFAHRPQYGMAIVPMTLLVLYSVD